jgi:hypothetical protein
MRLFRPRVAVLSWLVLAVLALGGLAATSHGHEQSRAAVRSDLPIFEAGHERADDSLHIEEAVRVESSPCAACLLRVGSRGATSLPRALHAPEPRGFHPRLAAQLRPLDSTLRLPATRGPPRA